MPKTRIPVARRHSKSQRVKYKMSGRKSTKSGLDMTNEELIAVAHDTSAGKRRQKATVILNQRSVSIPKIL